MSPNLSPPLAVSSWSLHRTIGVSYRESPDNDAISRREETWGPGALSLMAVPGEIARRGIDRLEICHFQIPGHDTAYLAELKAALSEAGVTLQTLLIDDGDITDPANRQRDIAWIARWIEVAAALGAQHARVIAGKHKPSPETLDLAVDGLRDLARLGAATGVRVITENWFDTLPGPDEVNAVLDRLDGEVGFLADFGNWHGASKYADLAAVIGRAETCHAKCHFSADGEMDRDDYGRCLALAEDAGYAGPLTLIYEGAGNDEWRAIAMERDFVRGHFATAGSAPARAMAVAP